MGQAWYAKRGDREVGPVAITTLEKWAGVGRLRPSDYVRQQHETDWQPASETVQFKSQPSTSVNSHPDTKCSPGDDPPTATPFGEWYKERWLSKLRWYFQIPMWLVYGFVWIPIWYVATATPSGGFKRRWVSLSFTGKAVACLPLLLFATLTEVPESTQHLADNAPPSASAPIASVATSDSSETSPNLATEPVSNGTKSESRPSALPSDFTTLATSWSYPVPNLHQLITDKRSQWIYKDAVALSDSDSHLLVEDRTRLWNIELDAEVIPESDRGYSFTLPAQFSPSGRYMACIDGDVLRVWRLNGESASLVTSQSFPQTRRGAKWSRLVWGADDSGVFVENDQSLSGGYCIAEFHIPTQGEKGSIVLDLDSGDFRRERLNGVPMEFLPATKQLVLAVRQGSEEKTVERTMFKPGHPFYDPRNKTKAIEVVDLPAGIDLIAPGTTKGSPQYRFPSNKADWLSVFIPSCAPHGEETPSMLLSGGERIAAAFDSDGKSMLVVFDTKSWKPTAQLQLPPVLVGDGSNRDYRGGILCSSSDGKLLAGFNIRSTRTGSGKEFTSSIIVMDTKSQRVPVNLDVDGELQSIVFANDHRSLFALVKLGEEWVNEANRQEIDWRLIRVDIANGQIEFDMSGRAFNLPRGGWFSPSGSYLNFDSTVWSLEGLEGLDRTLKEGLAHYEERQWSEARQHLATVLLDPASQQMWWRFAHEYPELWGRCFDCYVAEGRNGDAETLLNFCDDKSIAVAPKSKDGEGVLADIRRRQADELRRIAQEQQRKAAAELAQFRAKNQRERVRASVLTKFEFIQELRNTMTRGRIDNTVTYAIFENYAFQDRIGDPDRNVGLPDGDRYFVYRCRDGNVGITVTVINEMVILEGLDAL